MVQELCQCLAPLIEEDCLLDLGMLDVVEKDPMALAPASASSSSTPDPEEEKVVLTHEESLHFRARGSLLFGGSANPHMGPISSKTTGICPLNGESNWCWFSKGYAPRSATRPLLSRVTKVAISHSPVAREVCYEYQSWVVTQSLLQLALFQPLNHLTPLPGFRSCEQILHCHEQLYHSLTPKNGQRHFTVHPRWNRTSCPAALFRGRKIPIDVTNLS